MSNQPSLPSSKWAGHKNWHELLELARILSTHFDIGSLLTYINGAFEQDYFCITRIYLVAEATALISVKDIQNYGFLSEELSPLMEKALQERRIANHPESISNGGNTPKVIAIPLLYKDDHYGVIQLEQKAHTGITPETIEACLGLVSQFSHAIHTLLHKTHSEYLQRCNDHLIRTEEISQSILSNLDRNSLINNILTLLHLEFKFSIINLCMILDEASNAFHRISISDNGIAPENIYYPDQDVGPLAWCATHREPVLINNTDLSLHYPQEKIENNIHSEMVIPLLNGEWFAGAISLYADSVDAFSPDLVDSLWLLVQNITVAIRNANLYHVEQMRILINDRLQKTVGVISADVSLKEAIQNILDELEEILSWDAAAVWLIENSTDETAPDEGRPMLRLAAARVLEKPSIEANQLLLTELDQLFDRYIQNIDESYELLSAYPWVAEIININASVVRNSTAAYEPLGALLGYPDTYSALGIPLFNQSQTMGMIILTHHLPDQYDLETRTIADIFSKIASNAIENIRVYTAAHDQAWISTVLLQVAEATQSITNLDELLESIVNMLPGLIGVDACTIFLWDDAIEAFFSQTSYGISAEQIDRLNGWVIYPGVVPAFDQIQGSRSPVLVNNDTVPGEIASQVFPGYDFEKNLLILFPLISQNSLCGAILVDFTNSALEKDSLQEVWDEEYTLIEGIGRQTAVAIENLKLVKAQEEEAYISVALLQVAQAIVSLNQLEDILGTIVRITPILVGVKRCIVYLWDSKEQLFRQSESFGFSKNDLTTIGQVIKANEFPFLRVIQQRNQIICYPLGQANSPLSWHEIDPSDSIVVEGASSDTQEEISIKLDGKSLINRDRLLIGFPLSIKGELLGIMLIEEEEPKKGSPSVHIREKRIEIVKGITQQAAIAIKNELLQQEAVKSERMERELQLAREIQTAFLPDRLPEVEGWDIGARWQPARQVGGDFYDILVLDDDRIGIVIADVADKGMPAALFMTLIRTLIRAAAKEKDSPAEVLAQVNELLVPDSKHSMFVTVFYGVFYLQSGQLVYANCGHNPPIVKHKDAIKLIELTRTGMALGIFNGIVIEECDLILNPGDWVLLYTDGVTEAFSVKEELYGTQRLYDLLNDHPFSSSNELLDTIEGSVNDFIKGTDLSDDMTLAIMYRKAS